MQFFRGWVLIICLSIIGVSILEMITLNEKMNKIINFILGLFLLCSIIFPIKNFKFSDKTFDNNIKSSFKDDDFNSLVSNQSQELAKNNLKILINEYLKKENINAQKIKIFMDTGKDNCISISKAEIFICKDLENRKEEIKNLIKKEFEINTDIIIIGSD